MEWCISACLPVSDQYPGEEIVRGFDHTRTPATNSNLQCEEAEVIRIAVSETMHNLIVF